MKIKWAMVIIQFIVTSDVIITHPRGVGKGELVH